MNYWLLKTEPTCYSIDDLKRDKTADWTGIRNYQARNFIRDDMKAGDMAFIYHSSCDVPGIYGVATLTSAPHPDATACDAKDEHYDPKSTSEHPLWYSVVLKYVDTFPTPVTLAQIKFDPELNHMLVAQQGSRLSVQPVSKKHWDRVTKLSIKK